MKVSLLQPKIIRGNINHNIKKIQHLIDNSLGELLVLGEYALTGSLTLESEVNVKEWVKKSLKSIQQLKVPEKKLLILNYLKEINNKFYNLCEFFPSGEFQIKVYPDDTEKKNYIIPGEKHHIFNYFGRKFKVLICMDFKFADTIPSEDIDFLLWIYHFTEENYPKMLSMLKKFVNERRIPILASSLISDKNIGFTTYIEPKKVISLSHYEGILEIEI